MFPVFSSHGSRGGRSGARLRFLALLVALLVAASAPAQTNLPGALGVTVREERGLFVVTARFDSAIGAAAA